MPGKKHIFYSSCKLKACNFTENKVPKRNFRSILVNIYGLVHGHEHVHSPLLPFTSFDYER